MRAEKEGADSKGAVDGLAGAANVVRKAVRREERVIVTGYSRRMLVGRDWFSPRLQRERVSVIH